MANAKIDMGIQNCSACKEYNLGINLIKCFNWASHEKVIDFDKNTNEIVVDENGLMRAIQMINPLQEVRPIRLKGVNK